MYYIYICVYIDIYILNMIYIYIDYIHIFFEQKNYSIYPKLLVYAPGDSFKTSTWRLHAVRVACGIMGSLGINTGDRGTN